MDNKSDCRREKLFESYQRLANVYVVTFVLKIVTVGGVMSKVRVANLFIYKFVSGISAKFVKHPIVHFSL
jgi:hypothetical protein